MKKKKILYIILAILLVVVGILGYGYSIVSSTLGIDKTVYIYIDGSKDYHKLVEDIKKETGIGDMSNFNKVASALSYPEKIKTGRYALTPNMSVLDFVRELRNGQQTPIKLKFNNIRTKDDLAERISEQLMLDKESLLDALNNEEKCKTLGFSKETIVAMFIPNTYELYWNITVDDFLQRMNKEYENFWNKDRFSKATQIKLTPIEVSTLASIVEEECTYSDEYPMVAGLYLNRLQVNQALQADPTVKFAVGDFSLRRILNIHLQTPSPYNTYLHTGLPPGPIRISSIKGIDAVLNYAKHNYYYMCAKEDFSGRHNFANTFSEHQRNAIRYRNALNQRGIR